MTRARLSTLKLSMPPVSLITAAMITLTTTSSYADQTSPLQGIQAKTPNLVALTGATVVTEPGKTLTNATILIANGKISAVGTKVTVPAGYQQIDASQYHIYAGFIDPYTQYGVPTAKKPNRGSYRDAPVYSNKRLGGNASNDAIKAQVRWINEFKPDVKAADSFRQLGFTAVQAAQFDGIFRGQAFVSSLAEGIANELVLKADGAQFMSFSKGSSKQSYPSSLMGSIALIRQTLSDANWYQQAYGKADTRFYNEPVEFNAALQQLGSLTDLGAVFETTDDRSFLRADSLLKEFAINNAVFVGSGYEYVRINDVKASGRSVILPLNFPAAPEVKQVADQADVDLASLRHWERAPSNAAELAKAGVPFAFTTYKLTDKKQFWPNLRKAVQFGLNRDTALAALTTVPAKMTGVAASLGKIAQGYQADLVIANGDLFTEGEIIATWTRGQQHNFKPLQATAMTGDYAITLNGTAMLLSLRNAGAKNSTDKFTGSLKLAGADDKAAVALTAIKVAQQQLQFNVDLTKLTEQTQIAQFNGQVVENQLSGKLHLTTGQVDISASRTEVATTDTAAVDTKPVDTSMLSKLTFPNRAYGVTSLAQQQNVHIKNVTVWTAEQAGILEQTDVLVRNGKFYKLGQSLATPRGYAVIDGTGLHLTPGIIDEHSHVAIEMGVNEGTDAVTSEVHIGDVLNPDDINMYRSLAGGTTTAQLLHGSANPIGGQAQIIQFRWGEGAEQLKFKNAPGSIKFALGENVKQSNWGEAFKQRYPQTRAGVETTVRDAFQTAKEYQANWAAYNKLSKRQRANVAAPRKDYRLEVLVEILNQQRFIHAHSYVASEILMLMEVAEEMGFTITTFTHILEGYKTAKEMLAHGASASTFADWWAYKMEVQDAIPTNACLMAEQGLLVSINSDDAGLQRRLNQEAAKSVMYCGMDQHEALKMVTINPAKQLKIDHVTGSIAAGKQADFVLWSGHPLSVYSQALQTWIEGTKYFDIEADKQMQQQVAAEKQALLQKVLQRGDDAKKGEQKGYKQDEPLWHCDDQGDWLAEGQFAHFLQHAH
jgi:imidazolonepropionase-like amidohydrolase